MNVIFGEEGEEGGEEEEGGPTISAPKQSGQGGVPRRKEPRRVEPRRGKEGGPKPGRSAQEGWAPEGPKKKGGPKMSRLFFFSPPKIPSFSLSGGLLIATLKKHVLVRAQASLSGGPLGVSDDGESREKGGSGQGVLERGTQTMWNTQKNLELNFSEKRNIGPKRPRTCPSQIGPRRYWPEAVLAWTGLTCSGKLP